ncbi:hypothetical protein KUH03_35835 [Sphingobacterium sp. E70]|uniref:hypothetical protein n=1 Tax=Sphingobacterium sp. E70 TaxID=2853439 RepID=UPI00211B97C5|nr:hypothetical protein [Sphingobacterium sp. E70]ULT24335.1 hypothetical protein KUH03_35835 [Sphingobacterium sp. E70]
MMYIDLPKNVLIQRMRAGQAWNLACAKQTSQKELYKRYYFVDWELLNRHKRTILPRVEILADQLSLENLPWISGNDLKETLHAMSENYFRVRPTFEPGVWGGQWMKEHLTGIDQQAKNYAWSFEMIVPENGILLESNGQVLEISFDQLMFQESSNILGTAQPRFDVEFPIRFNFLDTFDGGNLSIQCHPSPSYAKTEFGKISHRTNPITSLTEKEMLRFIWDSRRILMPTNSVLCLSRASIQVSPLRLTSTSKNLTHKSISCI